MGIAVQLDPEDMTMDRGLDGAKADVGVGHVGIHFAVHSDPSVRRVVCFHGDLGQFPDGRLATIGSHKILAANSGLLIDLYVIHSFRLDYKHAHLPSNCLLPVAFAIFHIGRDVVVVSLEFLHSEVGQAPAILH